METIKLIPNVKKEGLRGGVIYHDGQFDDSRMAISLALTSDKHGGTLCNYCLLYTSPSPRDISGSRMPSSA